MNILFDIGHPAHVHLFRNFIQYLKSEGHSVTIVSRDKDITTQLLSHYNIPALNLSKPRKKKLGMMIELLIRDYKILKLNKTKKFDVAFGTSASIGHLTLLKKVSSYNFNEDDDETVPLFVQAAYPFNSGIVLPSILKRSRFAKKRIYHESWHELAYLHPDNFLPEISVLEKYSLEPRKYIIIRKSALNAHHDTNAKGLSQNVWERILELCGDFTIISTFEGKKRHKIAPWDMHHILSYARLLITDGLSMSIEASVLGVPSIRLNSFEGRSSVLREVDSYGLSVGINVEEEESENRFYNAVRKELEIENPDEIYTEKRGNLLREKIDMNKWMINWFEETIR